MTYNLDSVSFEGAAMNLPKEAAIALHEIAGSDTHYTQFLGKKSPPLEITAVLEDTERNSISALADSPGSLRTFSDSVTGYSGTVWIERYAEQEVAPGVWAISLRLVPA